MNASAYVLASHVGATIKGRSFPPSTDPLAGSCSPGPLAYAPKAEAASSKPRAARAVFGSAHRVQQVGLQVDGLFNCSDPVKQAPVSCRL